MCRNIAIIDDGSIIENTSMKALLKSLNSETFVLYLADETLQKPALQGFGRVALIDNHTLEVEVPKKQSLNELVHQLDSLKITVNRMRNKVNRLEELFINITSKKIKTA
jgi:ABC-2 type transport system ATP-binding protein